MIVKIRTSRGNNFRPALTDCGKVLHLVIPSEARNLFLIETQEKRDSSARSAPRNDKIMGGFPQSVKPARSTPATIVVLPGSEWRAAGEETSRWALLAERPRCRLPSL